MLENGPWTLLLVPSHQAKTFRTEKEAVDAVDMVDMTDDGGFLLTEQDGSDGNDGNDGNRQKEGEEE